MDTMIQSYMEETEEMLQKAEEYIIRLESEFSSDDINELFRIAHTIKGSSHMVGYEDLGNLMHKIEDMLDMVRNGLVLFNKEVASLCFEGLDVAKKILQSKIETYTDDLNYDYSEDAAAIGIKIQNFVTARKVKKENTYGKNEKSGIVSSLLNQKCKGKNKYYITFIIEEDAPMISSVLTLILKSIENLGTLLYSSVNDDLLSCVADSEIRTLEIILCTDIEEAELYNYFNLFYVEKINIINLNRNINEANDYRLNVSDYTPYMVLLKSIMELSQLAFCNSKEIDLNQSQNNTTDALGKLSNKAKAAEYAKEFSELFSLAKKMFNARTVSNRKIKSDIQKQLTDFIEKVYYSIKGKYIIKYIKPVQENFINSLKNFIELINKTSTIIILIDLQHLYILHEREIKELVSIGNELQKQGIELGLITYGSGSKRIFNIFDSIKPVYEFNLFSTELDAILRMFISSDTFQRINKKINQIIN